MLKQGTTHNEPETPNNKRFHEESKFLLFRLLKFSPKIPNIWVNFAYWPKLDQLR